MPTLKQLLQQRDSRQIWRMLIGILQSKGYPATDWEPGSVQRTILEAMAAGLADLEALRIEIAKGGYLDLASGDWLDLVAKNMYGLERKPALFATHIVRLSAQAGLGPYTIQPGQLWAATASGLRFSNVSGGTLGQGGELELEFKAESPGSAYNVPIGSIGALLTPLPGVSIANIALAQTGADAEDDESLRLRCRLRWPSLGAGATADAYRYWALSASSAITKVRILDQHPRGQGTVDIIVWGDGGLDAAAVAAANAYIQERKPLTADVAVYAADEIILEISGSIIARMGYLAQAQEEAAKRIAELQRKIPIGGKIYRSAIIEALFSENVVNVELLSPNADIALAPNQAATFSMEMTYQEA